MNTSKQLLRRIRSQTPSGSSNLGRPLVCIIVENSTYPYDTRVNLEVQALNAGGYDVVVIGPALGEALHEYDGRIEIWRYPLRQATSGIGYLREYALALAHITRLLWTVTRKRRPNVVHVCNPPDFLFLPVLLLKIRGTKLIYDLHDLAPEIFSERFSGPAARVLRVALSMFERLSVRFADVTIATTESYREHVLECDAGDPERVIVVRTGPLLERFAAVEPQRMTSQETLTIGYIGIMASQDGVEILIDVAIALRESGISSFHFLLIGDGSCLPEIRRRIAELGLDDYFTMLGLVHDRPRVLGLLAGCDLCVVPDPWTPANDASGFIKVIEYMALGRPIVASDLRETRRTAGNAARYVRPGDASAMATVIASLAEDPALRARMGLCGKQRIVSERLAWDFQRETLLATYDNLTGFESAQRSP